MSFKIFLAVILGGLSGHFFVPASVSGSLGTIADIGLLVLLFFVGIDIGKQKGILNTVRSMGFKVLLVPLATIIGSVVGGMVASFFINVSIGEGGALGSGLGWYTLSATILSREGLVALSALAFLSNVFREVIGLIIMPTVAKKLGYLEVVSMAGATAMDTSLPMISATTDAETSIIAFVSGVICTSSVPIILPIIIKVFG